MRINYFILIFWLFLIGCSSDDPDIDDPIVPKSDPLEGLPDSGPVRFDDPVIGQRSYYVFFNAVKDPSSQEVSFQYDTDTLVLAITAKESGNWLIKEFFTNGSLSKLPSGGGEWTTIADTVIERHLQVTPDSLHFSVPPGGDYFAPIFPLFEGEKCSLPRSLVSDPEPLTTECLPLFGYASTQWMEYTLNYTQFGQTFDHLNNYFDYRQMSGDGHGFMYAYGPLYGMVRWSWISYWDLNVAKGWDLIPK